MRLAGILLLPILTVGCANLTTISRSTDLPGPPGAPSGRAIHLDAQQRLVYASKDGKVCAEPSPDAIQAVAASLGAGIAIPSQGSASIAQALQQSTGSTGLRTQSITLLRDALYRVCEASYNRDLSEADVIQLLERSQDLTLGALAIEQLTGAVVAKQVVLTGMAQSTATANLANTQAQLAAAKQREADAKAALDKANAQLATDNTVPTSETSDAKAAREAKIPDDKSQVAVAQGNYDDAVKVRKAIEENFNAAMTNATAVASGSGAFNNDASASASTINKDTAQAISDGVFKIVTTVVQKGHLTDACAKFLGDMISGRSIEGRADYSREVISVCEKVITADLQQGTASQTASLQPTDLKKPAGSQQPPARSPGYYQFFIKP